MMALRTLNNDHIKVRTKVIALISDVPIIQLLLNHKVAFMRVKLETRASIITGWNNTVQIRASPVITV